MTTPSPCSRSELAAKLTRELIELRDALVSLSLNLQDWQFEFQQGSSRAAEQLAIQELGKFRLNRAP